MWICILFISNCNLSISTFENSILICNVCVKKAIFYILSSFIFLLICRILRKRINNRLELNIRTSYILIMSDVIASKFNNINTTKILSEAFMTYFGRLNHFHLSKSNSTMSKLKKCIFILTLKLSVAAIFATYHMWQLYTGDLFKLKRLSHSKLNYYNNSIISYLV